MKILILFAIFFSATASAACPDTRDLPGSQALDFFTDYLMQDRVYLGFLNARDSFVHLESNKFLVDEVKVNGKVVCSGDACESAEDCVSLGGKVSKGDEVSVRFRSWVKSTYAPQEYLYLDFVKKKGEGFGRKIYIERDTSWD